MNKFLLFLLAAVALPCAAADMVALPGGSYTPFYARKQGKPVTVAPFQLDRLAVTNGEFAAFVATHPEWGKTTVPRIFAEAGYLAQGQEGRKNQPVTNVSWFAASAYCQAQGKTLPTTDQWEYALDDQGRNAASVRDRVLAWYAVPNSAELPTVGQAAPNGYGVAGLVGMVWEWTADYSTAMAGPELRNSGDKNGGLFCGGGSLGARDPGDYASFMRYSFRASLKASYVTSNLGFRCASAVADTPLPGASLYHLAGHWTDQDGREISLAALRGEPVVLAMAYTRCKEMCPMTVLQMQQIEQDWAKKSSRPVHFAFFSFDWVNDTPERLKAYGEARGVEWDHWRFYQGGENAVRELAAALGIGFLREENGDFSHGYAISVLDADGVLAYQQTGLQPDGADIVAKLAELTSQRK
jgi:cytochrome oxidase Cu insertion factor (SCO1/SenC/PrrC family)